MTPRGLVGLVVAGLALAAPLAAQAQEINLAGLDDEAKNRVHVRTGAEHAFVAGVGYARAVPVLGRRLLVHGDLTVPWADLDTGDYRLRAGALAPIVGTGGWTLAGSIAPTLRGMDVTTGSMTGVGADLGLFGGYYARHWFVAGEVGFDWAIATHITHSDRYREQGYADVRDGWYRLPGGNLRYGLQSGASFGRYDVVVRAGQLVDLAGEAPLLPFYLTLTFDRRW